MDPNNRKEKKVIRVGWGGLNSRSIRFPGKVKWGLELKIRIKGQG